MVGMLSILATIFLVVGCNSGEEPARGAQRGTDPALTYQSGAKVRDEPRDIPVPAPVEPQTVVAEAGEKKPERDLGAELRAALGAPSECVRDFAAATATTIRISVSGTVRPTGMIIDPSAYGSGLSAAALRCIRERIGNVALQPLDDTVSKPASTVIEINYEPPVVVEAEPGVPEPKLRNVVEPLPKRSDIRPSGRPIEGGSSQPIEGGTPREPNGSKGVPVSGPKPRPIDGYEVDENAQRWR